MDYFLNKIDKHLDNHRNLDQNMNELKRKLNDLNGLKEDIESRLSSELQPTKKLKKGVQIWLENVERINGEIQSLDGRIGESSALTRGFHAEDVLMRMKEVEEHIQQGKFCEGLVVDNPRRIGQVLSTSTLSGEATKLCIEEISQCLMNDEVRKIGVWGMGGVGKTSIMKHINNQLLKETHKFDVVIWITVSKEMSLAKLQKDLASKLDVKFSGNECETTRAGMLFETLSFKFSRFVMILDDVWEKVSLEKPLAEEEAWNLFLEIVGGNILNIPGLEPVAKSITKHCAGLPLGVIVVAACMKGLDDLFEWRNALKELSLARQSVNGLEDEVIQQLRFSYDRLKDQKLQHCFLNCALYPAGFAIREIDLVHLWIAEGLVEEMNSRQAEYDMGCAIMNRLINNCLLEVPTGTETENGRCVKMHDLVRDMALHITGGTPRFLIKAGMRLTEPPDLQDWRKDLEKVSLMENWGLQLPYPLEISPPKCPMLTTLLFSGCNIQSIPEGFFKHMHGLKILDLSANPIKNLPDSIANLKNLTALLLRHCRSLEKVPSLSKLKVLKELNLEATSIKEIPCGMKNLLKLNYLNLNGIGDLHEIPDRALSKLSCLQDLIVGETLISGEDVGGLKKLEILKGRFYDLHNLNAYVQALHGREEPLEYIIRVGERGWVEQINTRKYIELCGCNIYTNQIILPHVEELYIKECNLNCSEGYPLFSRFILISLSTFSSLKFLDIYNCKSMKKLFSPNCLPLNLQELSVSECNKLEEIIAIELGWNQSGKATMEFHLPQLRLFSLWNLPKLKSICSVNGVIVCDSLEIIEVRNCPKLKRMPLNLSQLDNIRLQPSGLLSPLICIKPKEWWESVEWDHPNAKSILEPLLRSCW
ncbi:probable disease resistance protein At4g27220 [Gossypium hirsutum]|uniref:Probable disease resistance protein At4g27220 n=1 Tax=Gossypium hirsutum TaxID=3635 RepID=A0ABM3AZR7_GOSHI|nr:probable disease resistance protein At4g27220 [Gossypium hirsutum]